MSDVLILNGRLVDPASGVDAERDLLLRHGKVVAVEKPGGLSDVKAKEAPRVIERMLKGYLGHRVSRDETFLTFSRRHEVEGLKSIFATEAGE